jgi:hypothetical protein
LNWKRCWHNSDGGKSNAMWIWHGGDKSLGPKIIWEMNFIYFFALGFIRFPISSITTFIFYFFIFNLILFCYLYRYNYIDKHHYGELKGNCLLWYDEALNEVKGFWKIKGMWYFLFFFNFFSLLLDSIKKLCRKSCGVDLAFIL